MKKLLVCVLFFAGFVNITWAQDQLFKRDNTRMLVKVTEISPDEIKYKLFENLNGPTYVVAKNSVAMIIYENGQHQVFESAPASPQTTTVPTKEVIYGNRRQQPLKMTAEDSARFYKYSESVSVNFLNFMNSEVGLIYQKEFYKKHISIIVPVAVGGAPPGITQSVYFDNLANFELKRKQIEVGLGINYFPSYKTSVNYYIGPVFKYQQYQTVQYYYNPFIPKGLRSPHNASLSRYCMSITNGFIFRTRSRLVANIFGSLGFSNDMVSSMPTDPITNKKLNPIAKPFKLYFWAGFAIGFCF